MTGDDSYLFSRSGVKGQGHTFDILFKPCKHDKDRIIWARTVRYNTCYMAIFVMARVQYLLLFKVYVKVNSGPFARGCLA